MGYGRSLYGRRAAFFIVATLFLFGCGEKQTPYEVNLIENGSFEEFDGKLPVGWELVTFRGLEGEKEVEYGPSETEAHDGEKSFYFRGEDDTKRWYMLAQEVEVNNVTRIRLNGAIKIENVRRKLGQYTQCNFILIFYDKDHRRFQEMRYGDKRTLPRRGTSDWTIENKVFRVPKNTKYIAVGCLLGMSGRVWFDDLSLSVPKPAQWSRKSTRNFDFFWLPEKSFPQGSIENQQAIFDRYCKLLGITSDVRISYYLYPDSTTIRRMLSLKGTMYVSWDDNEIHTIHPNNDHEVLHFIMGEYGKPPIAIAEGSAFYFMGGWKGRNPHEHARELLLRKELPALEDLFNYGSFIRVKAERSLPACESLFGYLYEQWGPKKILELFEKASGTNSYPTFAQAFGDVYGIPLENVDEAWRKFLASGAFQKKPE